MIDKDVDALLLEWVSGVALLPVLLPLVETESEGETESEWGEDGVVLCDCE